MAEHLPRKRRIVKRAAWTLSIVALLGYLYVASYFALVWTSFRYNTPEWYLASVYKPLNKYNRSTLLGSREFRAMKYWMMNPDQSFIEAYEEQKHWEAVRRTSDTASETISD